MSHTSLNLSSKWRALRRGQGSQALFMSQRISSQPNSSACCWGSVYRLENLHEKLAAHGRICHWLWNRITLTACKAANLSFVMMLPSVVFRFALRQSIDAQEITFSSVFLHSETLHHETFQFENSSKLRTFHGQSYDTSTPDELH